MGFSGLSGKTALVTGGTSGIGRATVLALAQSGVHVVLTGRRQTEGDEVAAQARKLGEKLGVKATFVRGDVTDEAHIKTAVAAAKAMGGRLDFAFNNAGLELMGVPTSETTVEQYRQIFDVNVLGVLLAMKHEIRAMTAGGSIVNTSSVAGSVGGADMGVYVASKHAVNGLTKAAALEVAQQGIRVNTVSPAAIETAMFDRFTGGRNPEALKYMESLHPIGRLGKSEEIAGPVLFLFSDAASFITGTDLLVDGGFTAR